MSTTVAADTTKRKLQLALDVKTTSEALTALEAAASDIDVIEVGTILCLSAGMEAVRCIRAAYPRRTVLADVRIAEAGALIANLAFDAGADWVSVVSGAARSTVAAVAKIAQQRDRDVQIELSEGWTWEYVDYARSCGISQFIIHRSRDAEENGQLEWSGKDLDAIAELHRRGGRVSVTGGLKPAEIGTFISSPVEIFIAGRGIYGADQPHAVAKTYRAAVDSLPDLAR